MVKSCSCLGIHKCVKKLVFFFHLCRCVFQYSFSSLHFPSWKEKIWYFWVITFLKSTHFAQICTMYRVLYSCPRLIWKKRRRQESGWLTQKDVNDLIILELQPHLETSTITRPVFDIPHSLNPVWILVCRMCVGHQQSQTGARTITKL